MQEQAQAWWNQAVQFVKEAEGRQERFAPLLEEVAVRDPSISVPAIWALQQAGAVVIPLLVAGLQHPHTKVRRTCIDIIDHGGYGGDERCVQALLPLLHDPVPHIRRAVWHTIFCERCRDESQCEVGLSSELDQVALIIEIGLQDENLKLRRQLVEGLSQQTADSRVRLAFKKMLLAERDEQILSTIREYLLMH